MKTIRPSRDQAKLLGILHSFFALCALGATVSIISDGIHFVALVSLGLTTMFVVMAVSSFRSAAGKSNALSMEISDNEANRFCPYCGAAVTADGHAFCAKCGKPLS